MIYLSDKLGRIILFVMAAIFVTPASFVCIVFFFNYLNLTLLGILVWLFCLGYTLRAIYLFLKVIP